MTATRAPGRAKTASRARSIRVPCRDEREYVFVPKKTAVLSIDMQRDFFGSNDGEEANPMDEIIPRVAQLLNAARGLGCVVAHSREGYAADLSDVSAYRKSLGYVGRPGDTGRFLIRGEWGHDFLDAVAPHAGEVIIDKPGFSAFFRSDLHARLQAAGVDHLIICGVTTQCCVHSTLREAVDLGYWCLTVADCCAAEEQELHDATLRLISGEGDLFGWVCDLKDLIGDAGLQA